MSRTSLDAPTLAALDAAHVTQLMLIDMEFDSGTQYLTTAPHDVAWNGHTYVSAQGVGSIDAVVETDTEARGLAFTLSGVPGSAIAGALTEPIQGRKVTLRLGIVDGTTLRVDPNIWSGYLDVMTVDDTAESPTIRVTAEHASIAWQQPSGRLFSDADQQAAHAGDKFFEYAAKVAEATIVWPAKEFFQR